MKAVEDTMGIGGKVVEYLKQLQFGDDGIKEVLSGFQFDVGGKLFLEVEVTDKTMSRLLYEWLHSLDENGLKMEYFGCRLNGIHFGNPKDHLKEDLLYWLDKK